MPVVTIPKATVQTLDNLLANIDLKGEVISTRDDYDRNAYRVKILTGVQVLIQ